MPVDPLSLALMAVNVGASVFNNWRNNKQSHKLQEKQQEFARAAAERNKQRMWQLMREGQELALEMERETHENRLEDIRNDFDRILHRLAYIEAIKTWPLKVLPIVMKNQSLGSLTSTADENIAMHCILTPSNCVQFNKYILPTIEEKLADFCNLHWSTLSSHPILFYSGAWKTGTIPTGVEVSQLKTNLNNLPTLLITPFFKPEEGLLFQINAWGIGVELETEIECADFSYAESYKQGLDYLQEEDIKERTIEEFIPYLQCLIGYIADQYFWTNHNESPLLPTLLAMKVVNTDGMQYLNIASEERYSNLLDVCLEECHTMPFSPEKMLSLFEGSATLWDDEAKIRKLEDIFIAYCNRINGENFKNFNNAITLCEFYENDTFINKYKTLYPLITDDLQVVKGLTVYNVDNFPQSLLSVSIYSTFDLLEDALKNYKFRNEHKDYYLLLLRESNSIISHIIDKEGNVQIFNPTYDVKYCYEHLIKAKKVRDFFNCQNYIIIPICRIETYINRLSNAYKSPSFTY